RAAVDRHQNARDRWQELRERRLAGVAAELADELAAGDPCPVCGATQHPSPAMAVDEPVSEQDEATAEQAERDADQVRQAAQAEGQAAYERRPALRGNLAGREVTALQQELAELRSELEQASTAQQQQTAIAERSRVTETEQEERRSERQTAQRAEASATTEYDALRQQVDARATSLETARGE